MSRLDTIAPGTPLNGSAGRGAVVPVRPFPGDETPDLDAILAECKQGLPAHEKILVKSHELLDWYHGDSEKYVSFRPAEDALSWLTRPKRISFITRQAVNKLTGYLYKPGPRARRFAVDPDVSAWYERVGKDIHLNGVMQKADCLATLHGICAIGVFSTGDPRRPINYHLFPRTDFALWTSPDDPRVAVAVCTITKVRHDTIRYRLFTKTHYYTFYKGKSWGYTPGGWNVARYAPEGSGPHPYGVLPFAFITHELPTTELETKGLGYLLAKVNRALNIDKSNLAHWVHHYARPLGFVSGVGPEWRPRFVEGGFVPLVIRHDSTEDAPVVPEAKYLESSFDIAAVRNYIIGEANMALAELGVPLTIEAQSDGGGGVMAKSGIAISALNSSLLTYAKDRQPLFDLHETNLARLICRVGASPTLDGVVLTDLAPQLLVVSEDPQLRVAWPEPSIDMPGADRDAADNFELTYELTDPIELLMRRQGLTEDEAIEHFRQIQWRKQVAVLLQDDPTAEIAPIAEEETGALAFPDNVMDGAGAPGAVGDMGIPADTDRTAEKPLDQVAPNVSVTVAVAPNEPIPAAPLLLPNTPVGTWGTEQ